MMKRQSVRKAIILHGHDGTIVRIISLLFAVYAQWLKTGIKKEPTFRWLFLLEG